MSTPIDTARELIGDNDDRDYELKPIDHPQEFQTKAPALYDILRTAAVSVTAKEYSDRDKDAGKAQKDFKFNFNWSNWMVLITAFTISAVLAVGIMFPDKEGKLIFGVRPLVIVSVLSFIAGAIASFFLNQLRQGDLLGCWMSERARAELKRSEYFSAVANAAAPVDNDHTADLIRLEYFRRYQLGIQLTYYDERAEYHKREAKKAVFISSLAVGLASLTTAFSGFYGGKFTAVAAFGTAFVALGSFASLQASVYQNKANAERYGKTAETLRAMQRTLDEVRKAVQEAGQPPLIEFVNAVQEQLSLEHRQWIGLGEEQNKALEKLKQSLDEATKPSVKKEKAAGQNP